MSADIVRPAALGTRREASLAAGTVQYFESGPEDGPTVLFVHGLLVNADLWRKVVPGVAGAGFRTLAVDWPLGSHHIPMPDGDFTPPGMARLIAAFMDELGLEDVTIVANDTGGALTQILMAHQPGRIGRVVLTPSDSFERFFPPMFWLLPRLAKVPGGTSLLVRLLQVGLIQRLPLAFGRLAKRPLPRAALESYVRPSLRPEIRRDLREFLRGVHRRHTMAAAEQLVEFDRPVLLAWALEDRLFPIGLAERLAAKIPDARIARIGDSFTFVPEDQPDALVDLIAEFAREHAAL